MKKNEIVFVYNGTRCHALIVKELCDKAVSIGEIKGFEVYQIRATPIFDQFDFIAIKKGGVKQ